MFSSKIIIKHNKIFIPIITICVVIVSFFIFKFVQNNNLINSYDGLIYPGIYLNDVSLEKKQIKELENIAE